MFDELKEVKYFKEITDLKNLKCKNFKEIKRLKSLQVKAEAYRASTMEVLVIYLTAYYFRNKSSIIDIRLGYM